MGPVRPAATDDLSAGLYLLDAQHGIVLGGVENHQETLRRYGPAAGGPPGQVVVELGFAPLPGAPRTGRSGIEARIGGQLVGELSETDAAHYRPLLERAVRHELRPGCEAHVVNGGLGLLEVEIYLPVVENAAAVESITFPERAPARPARPDPPTPSTRRRSRAPVWWAAAATLLVAVMGGSFVLGWWNWPALRSSADAVLSAAGVTDPPSPSPPAAAPVELPPAPPAQIVPPAPPPAALPIARSEPRPPITNGGCDPNYSGCVPIASHVDCAGQGGKGPLFVRGPLRVTGTDVYELDRDGDGLACEVDPPAPPAAPTTAAAPPTSESSPRSDETDDSASKETSSEETSSETPNSSDDDE